MSAKTREYKCRQCGECCYQVIPLTIYDIHRIAISLGISDENAFKQSVALQPVPNIDIFTIKKKEVN